MLDTLVVADSHGTMADNSYFANPSSLYLGTGGVDDAEDADVIVHEYTHFLSWNANQSNGSNATLERQAIDEGLCQFLGRKVWHCVCPIAPSDVGELGRRGLEKT